MIDSESFYNRLRVKAALDAYLEGFTEYALQLQNGFHLTNEQTLGVIKMAISSKLANLSKMWKKVQPIAASFSVVDDGDYIGDVKEIKLGESKKGRTQVVTEIAIADGPFEGKTIKRFDGVEDEKGMGYFKNLCEVIGLDLPEDLELWQDAMDAFVANNQDLFNITVKKNGEYANVYVNGVSEITKGTEEEATGEEGETTVEGELTQEELDAQQAEEEAAALEAEEEAARAAQEVRAPVRKLVAKTAVKVTTPVKKVVATQPLKKLVARR